MTKLSVNINKIATLRNARGGNNPDVTQVALDCIEFGANGITVHPRPDQRHIRYSDVREIKAAITKELNIEGYPSAEFMDLVLEVCPAQVTLVPDAPDAITSNAGWDTKKHNLFLTDVIHDLREAGIRASVFVDANPIMVEYAVKAGTDRVELYTEPYARLFAEDREKAINPFLIAAMTAKQMGIGLNAGHDLSLENLNYIYQNIPWLDEVSIGHALICDSIYLGLQETIKKYQFAINNIVTI
ncbi:MAG: pyridoxine 5'-phosphate synthase [Bacteroidales bacterium]|jgi:pyridoxine 5-phosphate synthase|nr:pyridoxine 5'-phosphate synthase [Bacteroidales bacterium]